MQQATSFLGQALSFPMGDVLSPYIYAFYAAFIVAFVFTPIMRMIAIHYGIIDQPDGKRKMHAKPVAYLGGAAVFLGWMAGLACSQVLHLHRSEPGLPGHVVLNIGIVAGAIIIVLLGLWDDIIHISPSTKIAGQIAAAAFLLGQGVGTRCADGLLKPLDTRLWNILKTPTFTPLYQWLDQTFGWPTVGMPLFPEWLLVVVSSAIVIFIVVGCCNAANLMDGLDGLCGGVTAIIAAGFLYVAVHLASTGTAMNSNLDGTRIVLALALLGGVLGFVPYNFNPASIFMGDTGSMFLGFCCAVMIILNGQGDPKWFLASMVIFALPVLDTSLAFTRRYVNGRPLFSADRFHFHHQLVARGFTVKQTVLISYGLASMFGLLGCFMVHLRPRFAGAIYLLVFGFIIVAAYKMGMVHEVARPPVKPKTLDDDNTMDAAMVEPAAVLAVEPDTPPVAISSIKSE